ncbi:hypothetical protein LTR64_002706 [Lithohypha guttulata]|uniref:uncharacterized protein n=1 Tax=Lithohypha guttulata TaxID=1690604 RepID=UPI002DE1B0D9|nr:hypothetical protein LTR51_001070 [Lithohypha guttulata]
MSDLVQWLIDNEPEFSRKRLPSLYSDLAQQKSANPDGFAANATAWQKALIRAALAGQLPGELKIILRTSDDLLHALHSPRYGLPTGLGTILDEAIRTRKLVALKDFTSAEQSIYQQSWSLGSLLRWGLTQAGLWRSDSWDTSGRLKKGDLVVIEGLEQLERQLTALRKNDGQGITDRILSREAFSQLVAGTEIGTLTAREIECLLQFLYRDKQVLSYDAHTVKFRAPSSNKPESISEEDAHIANVKTTIATLESQVAALNTRIGNLQQTALKAVQSKNRNAALSALRSKKLAETALQQRTSMLAQVEEVYSKIEQAIDQVSFLQVMQASADTLKTLNKRVGSVEKVDAIMEDLREQMSETAETGQVLQEPLTGNAVLDEAEVDDELEAMEKEEQTRKEKLQDDANQARLTELGQFEKEATHKTVWGNDGDAATKTQVDTDLASSSQRLEQVSLNAGAGIPKDGDTRKREAQPEAA